MYLILHPNKWNYSSFHKQKYLAHVFHDFSFCVINTQKNFSIQQERHQVAVNVLCYKKNSVVCFAAMGDGRKNIVERKENKLKVLFIDRIKHYAAVSSREKVTGEIY